MKPPDTTNVGELIKMLQAYDENAFVFFSDTNTVPPTSYSSIKPGFVLRVDGDEENGIFLFRNETP